MLEIKPAIAQASSPNIAFFNLLPEVIAPFSSQPRSRFPSYFYNTIAPSTIIIFLTAIAQGTQLEVRQFAT